jgi:hypothetical protein
VDAAIRQESREGGSVEDHAQQHHRIPLGLILLTRGWITHAQLQHALDMQRRAGVGRIGQWLVEECGLEQERVTRALSIQWGCPVLPMNGFEPDAMALSVPKLLVEALGILPLRIAGGRILYLAFTDRLDASAAFAMERMSALKVQSGLVGADQWTKARQRLCASDFVDATFEQVADLECLSKRITSVVAGLEPRASRLVRVHQFYWLRAWLETGAMSARHGVIPATREDVVDRVYTVGVEQ